MSLSKMKKLPMNGDIMCNIINIIKRSHQIPYHSREFMWTKDKYVSHTVKQIINAYKNNEDHYLGVLIIYDGDAGEIPSITDGQHRITIYFLIILAIARIIKKNRPIDNISKYGPPNPERIGSITPTPEHQEILTKYGWEYYPNIESIYIYDLEALGNLLNNKVAYEVIGTKDNHENEAKSKIYAAYKDIYDLLNSDLPFEKLEEFYLYLESHVYITKINITEWAYTVIVFQAANSIKCPVPLSYITKNEIVRKIGQMNEKKIHDLFMLIPKGKDYEHHVHCIINLCSKNIFKLTEFENEIKDIIATRDNFTLARVEYVIQNYQKIINTLNKSPYYYIFSKYLQSGFEVMSICIIPICYSMIRIESQINRNKALKELPKLLRILIAFGIRQQKAVSFNSIKFQDAIKPIINDLLQEKTDIITTISNIKSKLKEFYEKSPNSKKFIEIVNSNIYSSYLLNIAKGMLFYLCQAANSHETVINYDTVQIDHIYPKSPKKKALLLENEDLKHSLGNLTPFIGPNTEGVIVGNMGLGNCSFEEKVIEYEKSNISITRDIHTMYKESGFMDDQIIERTNQLAHLIATLTEKDLLE